MRAPAIETFLASLTSSGLLSREQLADLKREIDGLDHEIPVPDFARRLVERQLLTRWQAGMLLAGQTAFFLGKYKLLSELGRGGMGAVFAAEQALVGRIVALKVMSRKLVQDERAVTRFRREIQAAAALTHPHVVRVFDADQIQNTHFLVMELVTGESLEQIVKRKERLPMPTACNYVRQAALGLQHAHEMGMVHRDIKPGNLFVTHSPDRQPLIKILDFGLARFTSESVEDSDLTQTGQVMGTPDYMAPEQARSTKTADIRSDIFSLGCVLFRLLTGRLPFVGENVIEKLAARMTDDAPGLRTLLPESTEDLERILARMLARNPDLRFQTPLEVATALLPLTSTPQSTAQVLREVVGDQGADLWHLPIAPNADLSHVAGEPLLAAGGKSPDAIIDDRGDPSVRQFLQDLAHEALGDENGEFAGAGPVAVMPTDQAAQLPAVDLGAVKISGAGQRLLSELDRRRRAEHRQMWIAGLSVALVVLVIAGSWIWMKQRETIISLDWTEAERRGAILLVDEQQEFVPATGEIRLVRPPGRRTVQITRRGYERIDQTWELGRAETRNFRVEMKPTIETVRQRELSTFEDRVGQIARKARPGGLPEDTPDVNSLRQEILDFQFRWSAVPEGLAAGALLPRIPTSLDRLEASRIDPALRPVWGADRVVAIIGDPRLRNWCNVRCLAFSRKGDLIVAGTYGNSVKVWDVGTGAERLTFQAKGGVYALAYRGVPSIAISPDGATIAVGSAYNWVGLHDAMTGERRASAETSGSAQSLAFSPDSRVVACGLDTGTATLIDARTGEATASFTLHSARISDLHFRDDGESVVSCGFDGAVKVWETQGGKILHSLAHPSGTELNCIAVSPDGKTIASAGSESAIRLWNLDSNREISRLEHSGGAVLRLSFGAQGTTLRAMGAAGTATEWNLESQISTQTAIPGGPLASCAICPETMIAAGAGNDQRIRLWDLRTGVETVKPEGTWYSAAAVSPNCRVIATGNTDGKVRLWNIATAQFDESFDHGLEPIMDLAFAPDGGSLASADAAGRARIWALKGRAEPIDLIGHQGSIVRLRYSPDGKFLLSAGDDKTVRIWDTSDGKLRDMVAGHSSRVIGLAIRPDGALFASCTSSNAVQLTDLREGLVKRTLNAGKDDMVHTAAFSRDGKRLLAGGEGHVLIWTLGSGRTSTLESVTGHEGGIGVLSVSDDGKMLVSSGWDGTVRVWEIGDSLTVVDTIRLGPLSGGIWSGCLASDGRHFVTVNANGTIDILRLRAWSTDNSQEKTR